MHCVQNWQVPQRHSPGFASRGCITFCMSFHTPQLTNVARPCDTSSGQEIANSRPQKLTVRSSTSTFTVMRDENLNPKFPLEPLKPIEYTDEPLDRPLPSDAHSQDISHYLTGWRLHLLTTGLCLGIFLVNFEISIVSTSLVSITNDLQHFSQSSWVVTAYLLTYTSFMIILARLSDVFGRKTMLLFCTAVFTVFSGGCAAAQTMIQLIVCRAFQGIGGSGVYSLVMVVVFEMVPPAKWPTYQVVITLLFGLAMVLGPIFGGLINLHGSWIWVFLLNVPGGVVTFGLLGVAMPNHFPNHANPSLRKPPSASSVDFLGAFLLVAAMALHITGLEQAANMYSWTSAMVLAPILISVVIWLSFFIWQWYSDGGTKQREPLFPRRFFKNRVYIGLLGNTFLNGAVSTSCIINIPIRYQAAVGSSPLSAGIRLIPFSLTLQLGAGLVAGLAKKRRMPPVYLSFAGGLFQLLSLIFMSMGKATNPDWQALYGLEVLAGTGVGMGNGVVTLMTPYVTEKRDLAVATASIVKFRFLGGATALAIITAVGNNWLKHTLPIALSPDDVAAVFRQASNIGSFPTDVQTVVHGMFVKSFNLQMRILIGFVVAQFFFTCLMWRRVQVMLE
ncbi:unnamed protein product [Periconia digitata]|uniref:Major facilitator superfamily (MFS) profile domain-containing protein n=1 Tax=Periconia digitata TaxID=1303443 RepID=A0A9W4U4A1_9PLEO|nr:unnamed protein product [Periconia digitata]